MCSYWKHAICHFFYTAAQLAVTGLKLPQDSVPALAAHKSRKSVVNLV